MARAAEALTAGDLSRATAAAEAAVDARGDDRAALRLLAALYEASGDPRAAALRARAGPAERLPPPPPAKLTPGAPAFVAAPLLTVRKKPSVTAAAAGWLPFGAKVFVERLEGDFARTRLPRIAGGARSVLELQRDGAFDGPKEVAFVHRGLLSPRELGPLDLANRADALERVGNLPEALRWRSMAVELGHEAARAKTVLLALELGHPELAVKAASPRPALKERWPGIVAEKVEVLFGCRGDKTKGKVLRTPSRELDFDALEDACVADLDTNPPCPPLPPDHHFSELVLAENEEEAEQVRQHYPVQVEEHQREVAAHERWMDELEAAFPDGPYLHLVLRNATDGYAPPLFLIQVIPPEPTCDASGPTTYGAARPLGIPSIPPRTTLDVWMQLDAYEGVDQLLSLSRWPEDGLAEVHTIGDPQCEPLCM